MAAETHVSQTKVEEVSRIEQLVNEYSIVGLAQLNKVPAKALHGLRDSLRGDVVITMSKKKLIKRAFENSGKENLIELANQIHGVTALLFTNMNPIKLAQFLESKAVKGPAKPGDIAPVDITVKAGDTKIAPGPIISELNQNLKTPTLIKNGTVHIRTDTVTHHVGDYIDAKQAQLLGRLGLEPMTIKLDFYSAWEAGEIIPSEVLHLNIDEILGNVTLAASEALNIALALGMMTAETVQPLLQKGIRAARAVGLALPDMIIPELVDAYVAKAQREASVLQTAAFGAEESAEPEEEAAAPEPEEPKEEEPAGLGSLFG
ncbi:MAG: 50S ribosomal protein L10 [Thermodesulfovibrionia bacterium]|nr:50S ribosomal protein L10 [Thermodesulfovibrionia bacterium]